MTIEIATVETFVLRLPARRDFRWLSLSRPLGEVVLARITDTGGQTGWGEVVALRDWGDIDGRRHGETSASVTAIVHEQLVPELLERPLLLGDLGARLDAAIIGNPYAKALLDIALHDLAGRRAGVPVHDLLGGRARERVPVAHMLGLMDDAETLAEARAAVAEDGVTALQVKGGADPERDIRVDRRASTRARAGRDAAARRQRRLPHALARAAEPRSALRRRAPTWSSSRCWDSRHLPRCGATRRCRSSPTRPAGRRATRWRSWRCAPSTRCRCTSASRAGSRPPGPSARSPRPRCLPHDLNGALELGIGNAANLHVALSSPAELLPCVVPVNGPAGAGATRTAGRYFEDDIVVHGFAYADGALLSSDEPGLGVEVDLDKVERYCVSRHESGRT